MSLEAAKPPTAAPSKDLSKGRAIRVMVVDDSAIIRGVISRWIEAEPDMEVARSCRNGLDAVNAVVAADPDVVVLDIEMPELDGISALPQLLAKKPKLFVIMASTLTTRNAEISIKALALGATDYLAKPESTRDSNAAETFHRDLVSKVRGLGARAVRTELSRAGALAVKPLSSASIDGAAGIASPYVLRRMSDKPPKVLLIGSSTGGPKALMDFLPAIVPIIDLVPVLITQHMPPVFTALLADQLSRACGRPVREGIAGERVNARQVYIAPGGRHMRVVKQDTGAAIALDDSPPINFCKPAVDPLFKSACDIWQGHIMSVILTGMGSDGMRGGKDIVAAGGSVIAQDEASSVVWGMPGAAAQAGICAAILPLNQIAPRLIRLFSGSRL
ncbi:MAG: chemotaxis response regulator protein-glutamate methylesterase [Tardiphaga sp.]|nr:chemotaxis response regulator protein-glutamate methylesterase [Tardiphaga sp.]